MNNNERNELIALVEWLKTFPQFEDVKNNEKENNNKNYSDVLEILDDELIARYEMHRIFRQHKNQSLQSLQI
jgi:hypothetical protein